MAPLEQHLSNTPVQGVVQKSPFFRYLVPPLLLSPQ
jgi:hypothetical protein